MKYKVTYREVYEWIRIVEAPGPIEAEEVVEKLAEDGEFCPMDILPDWSIRSEWPATDEEMKTFHHVED